MLNKEKRYTVYRHTSPNGKQYVGITCKPVACRWQNGKGYSYNKHFSAAINLYGWDNFTHEIQATDLSEDEAVEMEKRLIKEGDLTNRDKGYNHSEGGEISFAGTHRTWTDEQKKDFSKFIQDMWSDYMLTKKVVLNNLRKKGIVISQYLYSTTLEEDWLDYDPLNPDYCGEAICKKIFETKGNKFFRDHCGHYEDKLPVLLTYGLEQDLDSFVYRPEEYDEQVFDDDEKVAVINSKKGVHMNHYDYVLCPDGKKKKIYSREDIEQLQKEWGEYCDNNWLNGGKTIFDPESKVKFMLDGLANILLRNNMDGVLTEYKKMKIGKYEIPISVCTSMFGNELYSEREKIDNGEDKTRMEAIMAEAARKFDEARLAKNSKKRQAEIAMKKKKTFPPTRMQKINAVKKQYNVTRFDFCRVDTDNVFNHSGFYYRIPESCAAYAPKQTKDGDTIYDMDQIIYGETIEGTPMFFDMNIEPVEGVTLIGEQLKFF